MENVLFPAYDMWEQDFLATKNFLNLRLRSDKKATKKVSSNQKLSHAQKCKLTDFFKLISMTPSSQCMVVTPSVVT